MINNNIGAAAYTEAETRYQYLGQDTNHNVYAAELVAINLGVQIVNANSTSHNMCLIFTDSQAAITAVVKPARQSGQAVIEDVLDSIDEIAHAQPMLNVTIIWIPGHMDIPGNEAADAAAKERSKFSRGARGPVHTCSHGVSTKLGYP